MPARETRVADEAEKADFSAWMAVAAGTIGAFMATLDAPIVNAALPTIQGGIAASADEGTWISTSYLVAEIVMIPLAGWFEKIFGLRNFLLLATSLFIGFSAMCGLSTNLTQMIIGRVGQGFSGGALIPTALTIVATRLPQGQRPLGTALFGLTAVLGPVVGPLVGGWLTENVSWHYTFFINVPVGLALIALIVIAVPGRATRLGLLTKADWLGVVGLSVGLGCLTTLLEEGQRERWFESAFILKLSVVSGLGFVAMAVGQFTSRTPIIDLRLLFQKSFGSVFVSSLVVGAALYGLLYLIPQFLARVPDYNAEQAGHVALISGLPSLLIMPFYPLIVRALDIRIVIGSGLLFYSAGCFYNSGLIPDANGSQFVTSQILCGFGQALSLLFLNEAATRSVPDEKTEDASGLFNAGRNLGGSFGLALIKTMLERREDLHTDRISESISATSPIAQDAMNRMAAGEGGMQGALQMLKTTIDLQAEVMAYSDLYFILGVLMLVGLPFVPFIRPIPSKAS